MRAGYVGRHVTHLLNELTHFFFKAFTVLEIVY